MKISVSFLSIKNDLKENIEKLDKTTIDYLHLDIMDGKFVNNTTYNIDEIIYLLKNTIKPKDVHLMVSDVLKYIDDFKSINPEYITFHLEAVSNPNKIITYLKENKIKVGLALKPKTKVETILPYLSQIDLVLVMSVEPGYGGQKFISDIIPKIELLKELKAQNNYNYVIEVDGGINIETIKQIKEVDIVVVGSYITDSEDYQKQIDNLIN